MDSSLNFSFPVTELSGDGIRLVPFDARKHGYLFYERLSHGDGDAFAHFSSGPYASAEEFIERFVIARCDTDQCSFAYAILATSKSEGHGGDLVGMVSLTNADAENRHAHIGLLHVLPDARGKGVGKKACRLLLQYGLDPCDHGGLGLARMEWRASTVNKASIPLAQTLGLREVGEIRFERLLKHGVARGKAGTGRQSPPGTADGDLWRDVFVYEMTWDQWQRIHYDQSYSMERTGPIYGARPVAQRCYN